MHSFGYVFMVVALESGLICSRACELRWRNATSLILQFHLLTIALSLTLSSPTQLTLAHNVTLSPYTQYNYPT